MGRVIEVVSVHAIEAYLADMSIVPEKGVSIAIDYLLARVEYALNGMLTPVTYVRNHCSVLDDVDERTADDLDEFMVKVLAQIRELSRWCRKLRAAQTALRESC